MKKYIILVLFTLFTVISTCLWGQLPDPYKHIKRVDVFESMNDSIDLARIFCVNVQMEEEEIYNMSEDYENFDNRSIHYPRFDFSKKKDTTILPLVWNGQTFVHPINGRVTSRFAQRGRRYHYGIDLKLYTGDSVYSSFDGVVRISLRSPSYGYLVVVRHYNGLETYYAHLSKLMVSVDQPVKAGQVIGLGGNTGKSRGAHLHYEVRYLGAPLNPEHVIDFETQKLRSDTLFLNSEHFYYLKQVAKHAASGAKYHKIKQGETLSSIARKYQTSVANITKLNKISAKTPIRAGSSIRVR